MLVAMRWGAGLFGVGLVLACAAGGSAQGPVLAPGTPAEAPQPAGATAAAAARPPTPTGAGEAPSSDPASIPAECADDCVLLLDHPHAALQDGGFCDLCGSHLPEACTLDWPRSDVMPCERADWLRNCLYARLGYGFETAAEWRAVFEREPWYTPDPAFSWSRVSRVQTENAKWLKGLVRTRQCDSG